MGGSYFTVRRANRKIIFYRCSNQQTDLLTTHLVEGLLTINYQQSKLQRQQHDCYSVCYKLVIFECLVGQVKIPNRIEAQYTNVVSIHE
jgi:hypothetical protein